MKDGGDGAVDAAATVIIIARKVARLMVLAGLDEEDGQRLLSEDPSRMLTRCPMVALRLVFEINY